LSLAARIIVAVVAIGWVLGRQDWAKLGRVFQQLSLWYFALSLAAFAGTQLVIAFRWWLLLRAQAICIAVSAAVRLHFLGLFYNNVMPGSVGGDLLKAWYVTKHTDKRLAGALSVVVDRVIGLVGLVFMAVFAYLLFAHGSLGEPAEAKAGGAGSWLGRYVNFIFWILVGIMVVLVLVLVQPYGRARLRRTLERAVHRGVGLLLGVKDAVLVYCCKPLTVLWAMLLTFVAQSVVIVAFWLLGRNLGIDAGLMQYFLIFPVTWVVGALPISVAGLGVVEASTVELFIRLTGAPAENALALVLCQRLIWVVASLPGAVVHLLGAHLPGDLC
jgi:uncharacterized protein (TIRG00374 family)